MMIIMKGSLETQVRQEEGGTFLSVSGMDGSSLTPPFLGEFLFVMGMIFIFQTVSK